MTVTILTGDCRDILKTLPSDSVHCVVTSPPYWGLRDYGTATWEGGDPKCDHAERTANDVAKSNGLGKIPGYRDKLPADNSAFKSLARQFSRECAKCGARRIDGQMGLELSLADYVAGMVEVFREVRRVLQPDGTLWLNLGDSYATSVNGRSAADTKAAGNDDRTFRDKPFSTITADWKSRVGQSGNKGNPGADHHFRVSDPILKPKDLCGIPWRIAFALQQPYYTGKIKLEADRIWLAAMIDGEGCMFIHRRKAGSNSGAKFTKADGTEVSYMRTQDTYGVGLEVSNTHEGIVRRCMEITGQGSICVQGPEQNARRKQQIFRWNMRTNECREIIREIYPHLVAKQQQARILLGCPSSGEKATAAHQALIGLHNGIATDFDFPAPASMFEPGFYLRQDIIWAKKNCMPESVRDRCTKAHEYLFLLAKTERYYYDQHAISEDVADATSSRFAQGKRSIRVGGNKYCAATTNHSDGSMYEGGESRNRRSVWEIATQPFPEAHFATFPPALIEPCILAGCPKGGTVLDPFGGAGTTGLVADRLGRNAILIELNPAYAEMAERRLRDDAGMFAEINRARPDDYDAQADIEGSFSEAYRAIRARKAAGGPGWEPK